VGLAVLNHKLAALHGGPWERREENMRDASRFDAVDVSLRSICLLSYICRFRRVCQLSPFRFGFLFGV
jgi:hypothetical protein